MSSLNDKPKDFTLESNTAKREVKSDVADRIEVEIGDSKQADFKPQFKIKRWDNEVNFSMRATEDPDAITVVEDEKIKYKTKDYEVHQYEKPEIGEDGGFEFEWVLDKKPESNVFTATIQTKELDFFYQPSLTPEEIEQGVKRPDNIVGSYAVYHKTKKNNRVGGKEYKTGKAFHIYRPEAIDAKGNRVWCELNIDEKAGTLSVTVPDKWLNKAAYPVKVDPTFGYTSIGATEGFQSINRAISTKFTASEAGTITKITAYSAAPGTPGFSIPDGDIRAGVWNSSLELITNGVSNIVTEVGTLAWTDYTFTTDPTITATDYYIGVVHNGGGFGGGIFNYDAGATAQSVYQSSDSGGGNGFDPPSDYVIGNYVEQDFKYSVYATYTATGGGSSASSSPSASPSASVSASPSSSPSSSVSSSPSASVSASPSDSPSSSPSPSDSPSSSVSDSPSSSVSASPSDSPSSSPSPSDSPSSSVSDSPSSSVSDSVSDSPSDSVSASPSDSPSSSPSPSDSPSSSVSSSPSSSVSDSVSDSPSTSVSASPSDSPSSSPSPSDSPSDSVSDSASSSVSDSVSDSPSSSVSSSVSDSPSSSPSPSDSPSSSASSSPSSSPSAGSDSPSSSPSTSVSDSPSDSVSDSPSSSVSDSVSSSVSDSVSESPSDSPSSSPSPSDSPSSSPSPSDSPSSSASSSPSSSPSAATTGGGILKRYDGVDWLVVQA